MKRKEKRKNNDKYGERFQSAWAPRSSRVVNQLLDMGARKFEPMQWRKAGCCEVSDAHKRTLHPDTLTSMMLS